MLNPDPADLHHQSSALTAHSRHIATASTLLKTYTSRGLRHQITGVRWRGILWSKIIDADGQHVRVCPQREVKHHGGRRRPSSERPLLDQCRSPGSHMKHLSWVTGWKASIRIKLYPTGPLPIGNKRSNVNNVFPKGEMKSLKCSGGESYTKAISRYFRGQVTAGVVYLGGCLTYFAIDAATINVA